MADALVLGTSSLAECGFKSHRPYYLAAVQQSADVLVPR